MKESTHTYVINGSSKNLTSVTTLLRDYFDHFDPVKMSEIIAKRSFKKAEYRGKTAAEIREAWEKNGAHQADLGTALHAQLEQYYNDLPVDKETTRTVEWAQFKDFHEREIESREWVMHHAEWIIFDESLRLAGSIDAPFAAATNKRGEIILIDWKRTKDIDSGAFKGKKGIGPCRDIPDSKQGHYGVQLNTYKYILEHNYDVKVTGMYLAVFHPLQETLPDDLACAVGSDGKPCKYRFIEVADNPSLVAEIMALRRHAVTELEAADEKERESVQLALRLPEQRVLVCGLAAFNCAEKSEWSAQLDEVREDACFVAACEADARALRAYESDARTTTRVIRELSTTSVSDDANASDETLRLVRSRSFDVVLVFHNSLWDVKGPKDLVRVARTCGVPVRVIGNE
jgi:hypothetical protein